MLTICIQSLQLQKTFVIAKVDIATSHHFCALRDVYVLQNVTQNENTTDILPNKNLIMPIKQSYLPFHTLS